jgi:hypothetical protein
MYQIAEYVPKILQVLYVSSLHHLAGVQTLIIFSPGPVKYTLVPSVRVIQIVIGL